jgi:hypothetical protein
VREWVLEVPSRIGWGLLRLITESFNFYVNKLYSVPMQEYDVTLLILLANSRSMQS